VSFWSASVASHTAVPARIASVIRLLRFQRCHVYREPVFHIRLEQPRVRFVQLLDGNHFDVRGDVVLAAEVEHLLCLRDTANRRSGKTVTAKDEPESGHGQRLLGSAHQRDVAIDGEQLDVSVDVVFGRYGIENEIETADVFLHLVGIARDHDLVRAEAKGVILLVRRRGKDHDVRSEGMGEFNSHVPESTEADDTDLFPFGDAPMPQGRVSGNPGTQKRSRCGQIQIRRHADDKPLVHHNAVRVTAVSDWRGLVLVRRVIGECNAWAELLQPALTLRARVVGIDHASDRRQVAGLKRGDSRADLGDAAHDFVAWNTRIDRRHHAMPFVANLMKIRMTNAAEQNLDLHVALSRIPPRDGGGSQRRRCAVSGISFGFVHKTKVEFPSRLARRSLFPFSPPLCYRRRRFGRISTFGL
jgi:hypothetical protein